MSERYQLTEWRQHAYNVKQVKRMLRKVEKKKRAHGKSTDQKSKSEKAMQQAHRDLMGLAQNFLNKSEKTLKKIGQSRCSLGVSDLALMENIHEFMRHANRQIDQISRRVLHGEMIPHEEKVFSIFQPHTEWIVKGKAGVPVELGLRVCILEDQHQFILHHRVMEKETDEQIAIPMVRQTKAMFPTLSSCSFDKGFHSPQNQKQLGEELDVVALKRKGKLSERIKAIELGDDFQKARHKHSAVESAINALEVHGLDKCLDQGIDGFKRYVALAIVTRNIHRIGVILHQKEQAKLEREKNRERHVLFKLAA